MARFAGNWTACALCWFILLLSEPARAQSLDLDDLYARAAQEGEVSLYAQGPPQVYGDFVRRFEAKYPKIRVRVTAGRYDHVAKIDEQIAAGRLEADLASVQTSQDYVGWKRKGVLMSFAPPGFELVPAGFKDAESAQYMPLSLSVLGFAANSTRVGDADMPRTVRDFLKPMFKDKIVSTYPHDDDVTLYAYMQIVERYGWETIEGLLAQRPKFVRSHVLVAQEVTKGDRPVTFDQIVGFNKDRFIVPDDVPMTVFPYMTGIFAKAPHPNAAKLFLAFALSKEQQERVPPNGRWSPRSDVAPPPGYQPLSAYRIADGFVRFVSDAPRLKDLRARFEGYIGSPKGEYINTLPATESK